MTAKKEVGDIFSLPPFFDEFDKVIDWLFVGSERVRFPARATHAYDVDEVGVESFWKGLHKIEKQSPWAAITVNEN